MIRFIFSLLILIFFIHPFQETYAQADSSYVSLDSLKTIATPILKKQKKKYNPDRAALLAAVVPGLGQIYNHRYWKLPIVYGGAIAMYYWVNSNHVQYIQYRDIYLKGILKSNNDPKLDPTTSRAKDLQTFYRRTRDLAVILSGVFYMLTIVDAYTDAHLREFDISDDLTLKIDPYFQKIGKENQIQGGITLSFQFK